MDRCAAAYAYHKQGYNCAQSVAGAFADLTGTAPEQLMAAMGGFGGGVGGSHEELCGAVYCDQPVVVDLPFVTAKGAGAAMDFALELVSRLASGEMAAKLRASMQCR